MSRLLHSRALAAGLLAASAQAVEVKTPYGSFIAPDGLTEVNRDDKTDPRTGKPAGMVVLTRAGAPQAVYIVVWSYAEPDPAKPYDALEGAVRVGNPFDKALTRDAARATTVGGIAGGLYEGTLPNGQRAISYVAANAGHRLVVLLKGPASGGHKDTSEAMGRGIERFNWVVPAGAAASAP